LTSIDGTPPDLFSPPRGCPFVARCSYAMEVCDHIYPAATELSPSHDVNSWLQDARAKKLLAVSSPVNGEQSWNQLFIKGIFAKNNKSSISWPTVLWTILISRRTTISFITSYSQHLI